MEYLKERNQNLNQNKKTNVVQGANTINDQWTIGL